MKTDFLVRQPELYLKEIQDEKVLEYVRIRQFDILS